jgi:ubiquinone/menaquinone biosynthesis C-methylase UbiE
VGIDLSAAMLTRARRRLGRDSAICRGDAACLPFPAQSFDWALVAFALHEMAPGTRAAVLAEMRRVIKETGRLGIIDYHPEPVPTFKGWMSRSFIRCVEFAAGRRHYINYRHFLADGGIPVLAKRHDLVVERLKRVSGGNIGIYQLQAN